MRYTFLIMCGVLLSSGAAAWSQPVVREVPTVYPTIQAAVDAANPGDEISILAGTYAERVLMRGKNLTISGAGSDVDMPHTRIEGPTPAQLGSLFSDLGANTTFRGVLMQDQEGILGGAILVPAGAQLTLDDCFIRFCDATAGGGVFVSPDATIIATDTAIAVCDATDDGGGLYLAAGAQATLTEVRMLGNTSGDDGGAISAFSGASVKLDGCDFGRWIFDGPGMWTLKDPNIAGGAGGAIAGDGAIIDIDGSDVSFNRSAEGGGAVHALNSTVICNDTVFEFNKCTGGPGGAISADGGTFDATHCLFENNTDIDDGGAVRLVSLASAAEVRHSVFLKNESDNGAAALSVIDCGLISLTECLFRECVGQNLDGDTIDAGALYVGGVTDLAAYNCRFFGNQSERGAVVAAGPGFGADNVIISQCSFVGNRATADSGGALVVENDQAAFITYSVFTQNSCSDPIGGALRIVGGRITATESVFWENASGTGPASIDLVALTSEALIECDIEGGYPSEPRVFDAWPAWVRVPDDGGDGWIDLGGGESANNDYGDLRLRAGSPLIDRGTGFGLIPDWGDIDNDDDTGEVIPVDLSSLTARVIDDPGSPDAHAPTPVDIGAYEFDGVTGPEAEADRNYDGVVNGIDVGLYLAEYAAGERSADLNDDTMVNGIDIGLFLAAYAAGV